MGLVDGTELFAEDCEARGLSSYSLAEAQVRMFGAPMRFLDSFGRKISVLVCLVTTVSSYSMSVLLWLVTTVSSYSMCDQDEVNSSRLTHLPNTSGQIDKRRRQRLVTVDNEYALLEEDAADHNSIPRSGSSGTEQAGLEYNRHHHRQPSISTAHHLYHALHIFDRVEKKKAIMRPSRRASLPLNPIRLLESYVVW